MRPSPRPFAAAVALAALLASPLAAQEEDAPWDVELEFGLNGSTGNSSFTIFRAGASAVRTVPERYELDFTTVLRYGTSEERVIADDAKTSVRFDLRPGAAISPFTFADAARDEIRRLDFQVSGGVGAKWSFLRQERSNASLSLATLYDYQNFDLPEGSLEEASESLMRWSLRLKADKTFGEGTEWEHVTFYKPVVDDFGDYVVEITNSVSTRLLERLSLAVEHLYLHDEVPPPGSEKDDQKFSILFRLGL